MSCIARLPQRLTVERAPAGYRFEIAGDFAGMTVQVCDDHGVMLSEQDAERSDDLIMPRGTDA